MLAIPALKLKAYANNLAVQELVNLLPTKLSN